MTAGIAGGGFVLVAADTRWTFTKPERMEVGVALTARGLASRLTFSESFCRTGKRIEA